MSEQPEESPAAEGEEIQSVKLPIGSYVLINMVTFCVPASFSLLEIILYWWLAATIPSIPFILWDWLGAPGMWLFFLPLAIVGVILTYITTCVLVSTKIIQHWNKKCPPEEGYFKRTFTKSGVADPRIDFYHKRGFTIKWPMWVTSKSPFPWLVNWCLRRNDSHFGKDVIFDDAFVPLELANFGDGVYFGPGAAASAHVVNAIFGDLYVKEITIGDNTVIGSNIIIGPGAQVPENRVMLPNTLINSRWKDKWGKTYYSGTAARPIPTYSGVTDYVPSDRVRNPRGQKTGERG